LAVVLPDGTTLTPALTVAATVSPYTATLPTTQPGRHVLTWSAAGNRVADICDVWPADPRYILSIDDAIAAIGPGPQAQRDDIGLYVATATWVIEMLAGPVISEQRTFKADGGRRAIVLPALPVQVTSVTVSGSLLDPTTYVVDEDAGVIYGLFPAAPLPRNVTVLYRVGAATIPANLRLAATELVRHLWSSGRRAGRPGAMDAAADLVATPFGFAIPKRVVELCSATKFAPGFA
jgi:hypothetical protein